MIFLKIEVSWVFGLELEMVVDRGLGGVVVVRCVVNMVFGFLDGSLVLVDFIGVVIVGFEDFRW